jgi:hypothetical protein
MNRIITFITELTTDEYATDYVSTKYLIENTNTNIVTPQLSFICFDLLDKFDKIFLIHENKTYELKLGKNSWTEKELRKEHNLFKLVQSYILNNKL